MDNFTLAVIVADVAMCLAFAALIILDRKHPVAPTEAPKPASGKRSA